MVAAEFTQATLSFESLERQRFEDLVRQLVYNFRSWRQLEPIWPASSTHESSNILGLEIVGGTSQSEIENEGSPLADDRVWLVTCKSDKILGPTKLTRYLESIPTNSLQNLHGLVFASPCTFSKKAIDVFHDWCSKKGIVEFYLWGRDEIEKLLYHSENDQLLFTYFNLSVSIRRQKLSSLIHQQVALKRRLKQLFPGDLLPLVLRDVADDRYPDTKGCGLTAEKYLWLPCFAKGIAQEGLCVLIRQHWAYCDVRHQLWDFASAVNLAIPEFPANPWYEVQTEEAIAIREERKRDIRAFWSKLPANSRHYVLFFAHIRYKDIIEVDDVGDDLVEVPTIFVNFVDSEPPLSDRCRVVFQQDPCLSSEVQFPQTGHARVFPDQFRNIEWEREWFRRNEILYETDPHVFPASRTFKLALPNRRSIPSVTDLQRSLVKAGSQIAWPIISAWWPLKRQAVSPRPRARQ